MQVNRAAGFTFSSAMRNFLRHDPDVIMVGEIRDRETADIAVESALTGHLLLSTLHTNTAAIDHHPPARPGASRPYLLRASLLAVISQRLVRLTCPHCRDVEPVHRAAHSRSAGCRTLTRSSTSAAAARSAKAWASTSRQARSTKCWS
jgi:type IV pilus assembly protein PilB